MDALLFELWVHRHLYTLLMIRGLSTLLFHLGMAVRWRHVLFDLGNALLLDLGTRGVEWSRQALRHLHHLLFDLGTTLLFDMWMGRILHTLLMERGLCGWRFEVRTLRLRTLLFQLRMALRSQALLLALDHRTLQFHLRLDLRLQALLFKVRRSLMLQAMLLAVTLNTLLFQLRIVLRLRDGVVEVDVTLRLSNKLFKLCVALSMRHRWFELHMGLRLSGKLFDVNMVLSGRSLLF